MAQVIRLKLNFGYNIIANFPIQEDLVFTNKKKIKKGKYGRFIFLNNDEITPEFLINFAMKNHKKGKEGQTILILDEAQIMFNPREWNLQDRKPFINFLCIHRHLGYNIIFATPSDQLLDRQIRALIEYEHKHRKVNNYKFIGSILPFKTFVSVRYWYCIKQKIDSNFFLYRKKDGAIYDSYSLFDKVKKSKYKYQFKKAVKNVGYKFDRKKYDENKNKQSKKIFNKAC